ncbi:hypothetical protein J6590_072885 [Homalodisca vitripennis]|nr:hypothetical protein J6590_072885 [Homalodisca vitripennis]
MSSTNYKDRSSDLRELVGEPMSSDDEGQDSDFDITREGNFSDSLSDSSSDDDYVPNADEIDEWNLEQHLENVPQAPCRPNLNSRPRPESPNLFDISGPSSRPDPQVTDPVDSVWVSVFPPEPVKEIPFLVRESNTGPRNCPARNSPPIMYLYLFFTQTIWRLISRETNIYAQNSIDKARNEGKLKTHSRVNKWVPVTKQYPKMSGKQLRLNVADACGKSSTVYRVLKESENSPRETKKFTTPHKRRPRKKEKE